MIVSPEDLPEDKASELVTWAAISPCFFNSSMIMVSGANVRVFLFEEGPGYRHLRLSLICSLSDFEAMKNGMEQVLEKVRLDFVPKGKVN